MQKEFSISLHEQKSEISYIKGKLDRNLPLITKPEFDAEIARLKDEVASLRSQVDKSVAGASVSLKKLEDFDRKAKIVSSQLSGAIGKTQSIYATIDTKRLVAKGGRAELRSELDKLMREIQVAIERLNSK